MLQFKKYNDKAIFLLKYSKWFWVSILVGIILGYIAGGFHYAIDISADLFKEYKFLLFLLPIAGGLIAFLYKISKMEKDNGTNGAIISIRDGQSINIKVAPLIFISSTITHLVGGSSGREGAALQLGSSIGNFIGEKIKLDSRDQKIIVMCGMAAAFSALFGTPITAAIFAIEVASIGIMHYSALLPCCISAVTSALIAKSIGIVPTSFIVKNIPDLSIINILKAFILIIICALFSIIFCKTIHFAGSLYKKINNTILRGIIGGSLVLVMTLLIGNNDYNGAGMNIITNAINGEAFSLAFLIKIIMTALTLGAGFKGGEIVPAFFTGATLGCVVAPLIGLDAGFGAALGIVSLFCGVTNCPVSSMFLALELFGEKGIIFYGIACAASYVFSGSTGLYHEQTLVYSKTKPMEINLKTK